MASKIRVFLKYALIAAGVVVATGVVALLGLWLAGGGVHEQTTTVRINAPREEVFRHLTEPELLVQWMDGVEKIEPLDDLGHTPGARSRVTIEVDGGKVELDDELVEYNQPERLAVKLTSPYFEVHNTYQLTEEDGVTTVHQTMEAEYHGAVRMVAPFVGDATQKQLDGDIARLKKMVEKK